MYELTEYDLERQRQSTNMGALAIDPKSIHRELMCPICLDILKTTMTTRDCLHRFCDECIKKALMKGNKECPTCRKRLVSKRNLRPDPNFDDLIKRIYPKKDVVDKQTQPTIDPPTIEVVLRHLNCVLNVRFIKCSSDSTIGHLALYLSMRPVRSGDINNNQDGKYKLAVVKNRAEGRYEPLDECTRLREIAEPGTPLELYYYKM